MSEGGFDVGSIVAKLGAVLDPRGFRDFDRAAAAAEARAGALERSVNARKIGPKVDRQAFSAIGQSAKKASSDATSALMGIASTAGRVAKTVGLVMGVASGVAAGAVVAVGLKFDMMVQRAQIGFTTMLGSAKAAKAMLADLQHFAATTPFQFGDLVQTAQRMVAMGIAGEKVIPTLRAIGDAEAQLGGGKEGIERVTTALGQMQAKGKVSAEEMRQLAEAGIPAWRFLADATHQSISKTMQAVTDGKIAGQKGVDAIVAGMERRFGGGMAKISKTLSGQWSNLLDNLQVLSGQLALPLIAPLTAAVGKLNDIIGRVKLAPTLHAKATIVWDNLGEAAGTLITGIRHAVLGVKAPTGQTGRSIDTASLSTLAGGAGPSEAFGKSPATTGLLDQFKALDWRSIGASAASGIASGISAASSAWGGIVNGIANAVEANMGRIAEVGAELAAKLVMTIADPGFWVSHWELALGVAIAVFPVGKLGKIGELLVRPFGRLGGVIGSLLGSAFLEGLSFVERLSPRLAAILLRIGMDGARALRGLATGIAEGLWGAISGAGSAVASRGGALFRTIFRLIVATGIVGAISGAVGAAANLAARIISALSGGLADVGHAVSKRVRQAGNGILEAGVDAVTKAGQLGSRIASSIVSGIGNVGSRVAEWIRSSLSGLVVHITPHVSTTSIAGVSVPTGVSFGGGAQGARYARGIFEAVGGIVRRPAMIAVGEEAPTHEEFVIPTNPAYRGRARNLLGQAAAALGVGAVGLARGDALTRAIRKATRLRGAVGREATYQQDADRRYQQDTRAFDLSAEDLSTPTGVAKRRGELATLIGEKLGIRRSIVREESLVRRELKLERGVIANARKRRDAAKRAGNDSEAQKWGDIFDAAVQRQSDLLGMRHDLPFALRDIDLDVRELRQGRTSTTLQPGGGLDVSALTKRYDDLEAIALAGGGGDPAGILRSELVFLNALFKRPGLSSSDRADVARAITSVQGNLDSLSSGTGSSSSSSSPADDQAGLVARTAAISASIAGALGGGLGDTVATGAGGPTVVQQFSMLVPPTDPGALAIIARAAASAFDASSPGMAGGTAYAG